MWRLHALDNRGIFGTEIDAAAEKAAAKAAAGEGENNYFISFPFLPLFPFFFQPRHYHSRSTV